MVGVCSAEGGSESMGEFSTSVAIGELPWMSLSYSSSASDSAYAVPESKFMVMSIVGALTARAAARARVSNEFGSWGRLLGEEPVTSAVFVTCAERLDCVRGRRPLNLVRGRCGGRFGV